MDVWPLPGSLSTTERGSAHGPPCQGGSGHRPPPWSLFPHHPHTHPPSLIHYLNTHWDKEGPSHSCCKPRPPLLWRPPKSSEHCSFCDSAWQLRCVPRTRGSFFQCLKLVLNKTDAWAPPAPADTTADCRKIRTVLGEHTCARGGPACNSSRASAWFLNAWQGEALSSASALAPRL